MNNPLGEIFPYFVVRLYLFEVSQIHTLFPPEYFYPCYRQEDDDDKAERFNNQ